MRYLRQAVSFVFAGCFCVAPALGADDAGGAPAGGAVSSSQPETNGSMQIIVTAVSGLVQVRDAEGQPWRTATLQMVISEGAELRTGPHSSVTCVIPPDQTFTLDRLGTVRVQEAVRNGNKVTTDLIMKYGRTHYDIESAGLEHEASIISPSSTLAVRGTNVELFDQPPFKPEATSFTGRAQFTSGKFTVPVGSKGGTLARALAGSGGVADTALSETVVDPRYVASLTATDQALISNEVARGAVLSYDPVANIPVITNSRPTFDADLPGSVPGTLSFVLRWTGDADLNIEVGVDKGDPLNNILNGFQQGEFLYPGYGFQNSPSGGHIPFDNRGGPNGGEEFAYWNGAFPTGLYGIAVQSISGPATSFTFNAFANGQPLEMFYFASDGVTLVKSTQVTHIVQPGQNDTALVPVPDVPLLDGLIPDDPAGNPNPGINPSLIASSLGTPVANNAVALVSPISAVPAAPPHPTPRFLPTKQGVNVTYHGAGGR